MAPAKRIKWRFISAGSTLATVLSVLALGGFTIYINKFNQYNKLYGSIGTLLIILLLMYVMSLILLLGFELNVSIHQAKKPEKNNAVEEQQIISVNKFIVLSILTFGLYEAWWIYKSWRFFQQKDKLDIMPAVRTIFSIFFLIPLFNKILDFANGKGYNGQVSSVLLFIGFFVGNLLVELPYPFSLISLLSFVFLIPSFNALNFARQNSTDFIVTEQSSYNGRQIALIIVGAVFWVLVLL